MTAARLIQSDDNDSVPFITVERDERGSACWAVIGLGKMVRCYSGERAIAVLQMMCASKGILTPISQ
jgi:hypothetical protein